MKPRHDVWFFGAVRLSPTLSPAARSIESTALRAWEYRDPLEVIERREEDREQALAVQISRETADREIEKSRQAVVTPLSPITALTVKRMRIRELVKQELLKARRS
jgi:hypothetical protein